MLGLKKSVRSNAWTKRDYQILKRLYPDSSVEEIGALLGRTPRAVQSKAAILRLKKANNKDVWTETEIQRLKEMHPDFTTCEIAERMGRSPNAVKSMAKRLKLKKANRWTPTEIQYVKKYYAVKGCHFIARKVGHSPAAVKYVAGQLGVSRKTIRKKWTKHEEEQLIQLRTVHTYQEIAEIMDRTLVSIKLRCYKMGFRQGQLPIK